MIFTPPHCSFRFITENSFATQSINAYFCAPIVSISLNYPVSTLPKPLNVIIIPHHQTSGNTGHTWIVTLRAKAHKGTGQLQHRIFTFHIYEN